MFLPRTKYYQATKIKVGITLPKNVLMEQQSRKNKFLQLHKNWFDNSLPKKSNLINGNLVKTSIPKT